MLNKHNINRKKMIVKLIIITPLFLGLGLYFSDYFLSGNLLAIMLFITFCSISGYILSKI